MMIMTKIMEMMKMTKMKVTMMASDLQRRLSPPLPNLSPGAAPSAVATFS